MVRMQEIQAMRSSSTSSSLSARDRRSSVIGVRKDDNILSSCYYCYYYCYRESSLDLCSPILDSIFRDFANNENEKSHRKTVILRQQGRSRRTLLKNNIIGKSVGNNSSSAINPNDNNTFSTIPQFPQFVNSQSTTTYPSSLSCMYQRGVDFEKCR